MRKIFTFVVMCAMTAMAWAADTTIEFAAELDTCTESLKYPSGTYQGFTFTFDKGDSSTDPVFFVNNTTGVKEMRLYSGRSNDLPAGNAMTIASADNMTSIVLAGGSNFTYGSVVASTGAVEYDSDNRVFTWTGDAATVTLTVTRESKACQLRFATATITTAGGDEPEPEPLAIDLTSIYDIIEAGASSTIEPAITGGTQPYTIEWRNQMNEVIGTEATAIVTPANTQAYRLTVTSADGQTATAKTAVWVLGEAQVATFDDNYLPQESYFNGDSDDDMFYSGSYGFHAYNYGAWWGGMAMSNQTATGYETLDDQYHNITGQGAEGSATFGVGYSNWYGQVLDVTNSLEGDVIKGAYFANNSWAYDNMLNGDGAVARAFTQGDWLKVTATGYDAEGDATETVEFYLGDYRSENEADRYLLDTWQWVDLSPLGQVSSVSFVVSGSDSGTYGLNTAAYFAIDNVGATRPEQTAEQTVLIGDNTIYLGEFLPLPDDGSTTTYELVEGSDNATITAALEDDALSVSATTAFEQGTVLVAATNRGVTTWLRLVISVSDATGVNTIDTANAAIVGYYTTDGRSIDAPVQGINIVRYSNGATRKVLVK